MVKTVKINAEKSEKKIHISFSEFSKYQECPHRHLIENYLKLEEQLPSIHLYFGSAIHKAIELGFTKKYTLEQRISHFTEMFQKSMDENLKDDKDYNQVDDFIKQGVNILKNIKIEKILENYDVIGTEELLYEHIFEIYYFKGFIDIILRHKKTGKIVIMDWKTSGEAWDVGKKMLDIIFTAQMKFYKYFYGKKYKIPFENIDCKYIVLNRLKNKKNTFDGFGEPQKVNMNFSEKDIEKSLNGLIRTIKQIHIEKHFPKAKLNNKVRNCFFCPYKEGHPLCDGDDSQHKKILLEHSKLN